MLTLTRFSWASLSPRPSCIYSGYQNVISKFSSRGSAENTEISQFPKDIRPGIASRVLEKQCSLYEKETDLMFVQTTSSEDSSKSTEAIHDLRKKIKLLLKESKGTRRQCIVDRDAAEALVRYLKKDLGDKDTIVEASPGLGLLTETILSETNNTVVVYEPNNKFRSNLKKSLQPQNSCRLQIQNYDFEKFYGYYMVSQRDDKSVLLKFLHPMLKKEGTDILPVKIVGVIYDSKFISRLSLCFAFQCSLYEEISPVFYLYIPFNMYWKIAHDANLTYEHGFLFRYYFDVETLHVVPKESFHPICTKSRKRRRGESDDRMYLVKISPKKDLFQKVNAYTNSKKMYHIQDFSIIITVVP